MRRKYLFALVLCSSVVVIGYLLRGCTPGPAVSDPLPADNMVAKIEIEVYDKDLKENVRKELPLSAWSRLHRALLPAYEDTHALKWEVVGNLYIQMADGSHVDVAIGTLGDGNRLAPFFVGPAYGNIKHYQGGNQHLAHECYRAALEEAGIQK